MTKIFDLLTSTSFTTTQLRRRAMLIKTFYEKYIYQSAKPHPQDFFTNPLDWQWFLSYQNVLYQALSSPDAKSAIKALDDQVKALRPITCFTAVPIPEDKLDFLISKLRTDIGPQTLLLDIRVDPAIIGGCVIIKDGLVKDYSLRNKISHSQPQIIRQLQEALPR